MTAEYMCVFVSLFQCTCVPVCVFYDCECVCWSVCTCLCGGRGGETRVSTHTFLGGRVPPCAFVCMHVLELVCVSGPASFSRRTGLGVAIWVIF